MAKLSALIITFNEQDNIEECIKSVQWADEIIVVDSKSEDSTVQTARKYTDKVYINEFKDFSSQKNFCLSKATCEWVLFLDADERITESLRSRLKDITEGDQGFDYYYMKRKIYIFGRLFKYGGHDKDYQLRLFKRGRGQFYQPVHERIELSQGSVGCIEEPILHYSSRSISQYVGKLNLYTTLESAYMAEQQKHVSTIGIFIKPLLRFVQKYIIQQGFRDGPEGFLFYTFSSYYDFVKYAKLWEINKTNIRASSDRIKILYVDDVFDFGGGEVHLLSLISRLDRSKYEISVACRKGSVLLEKSGRMGCDILHIKFRNKFDIVGLFLFYRMLVKGNFDIVHLQDNRSHWIGSIAAKMARVPIRIATVHMVNILRRENPSAITAFLLKIADRIWSSLVDSIVTVSESNKAALIEEKIPDKKIKVIYNGTEFIAPDMAKVASLKKEYNIEHDDIVIGTVSRLCQQKGLEYLIKAASKITTKIRNACFVIIGDGPDRQKLINQIEAADIQDRVKLIGFKHNPLDHMAFFDIFVLPSVYEGLPIAIIEAMSLSIPVIASKVAGVPEIVLDSKNGVLVTPKDVEGLIVAIERLISEKNSRDTMGQEGRRIYQEKLTIEKMVAETSGLYQELLNMKSRG